jgi:peptidyl-prolyl cis-trans isomerase D
MNSNEKKVPGAETKKERVSVLESIRRRTGLLVGIVGLALLIFILESLLSSGQTIFGGGDAASVGSINGKNIDRNDFLLRVENQINTYKQQRQTNDVDEATRLQITDFVWQQMINDLVVKPQYDKVGIMVGEDELYDKVVANPLPFVIQRLTDPNSGRIYDQLSAPDGSLDRGKWKQFVQNAGPNEEAFIKQMEDEVKNMRHAEKYASLIKKGLYTTTAEAKDNYVTSNTNMNISFVVKRFDMIADDAVTLSDGEIEKYYKDHSYDFKNTEATRRIEYVAYNVVPSNEDLVAIEKDAQRVADEFKGKSAAEDSALMMQESENGQITIQDFTKKTMIVRDSSIFTSPIGSVFGPYNEGAYFKVYKLQAINSIADSAKVRHILIGTNDPRTNQPKRSNEQAKREADSLLTLLKAKKVSFDSLVINVSDDMGSKTNGGDYGWFDENKGFVTPFKNAGLMGTKGNITVVETQFGYHIIEVLDVSKTRHTSYTVAQIFKPIVASDETNQSIFAQANEFGGKNNNADLFDKAVEKENLPKRIAENIKEGDRDLPGLPQAGELVKWLYMAKKGDVAVFSLQNKHVVVKVSGIRNKGILPLEEVKEDVVAKAKVEKKGKMMIEEFNKTGAKNLSDYASKLGIEQRNVERLSGSSHNVEGVGHDDILIGTAIGTNAGQTTKPIIGESGVFVLSVNSKEQGTIPADFKMQKKSMDMGLSGRADYEAFTALKELADIEDHTARVK